MKTIPAVRNRSFTGSLAILDTLILLLLCGIGFAGEPDAKTPVDEAKALNKPVTYFQPPYAKKDYFKNHDYFKEMDAVSVSDDPKKDAPDQLLDRNLPRAPRPPVALQLAEDEIWGRNTWMMWCGGNEVFWDWLCNHSYGFTDFLKVIDSRHRTVRWRDAGMVNEPGMRQSLAADDWGVWLDHPASEEVADFRKKAMKRDFDRIEAGLPQSGWINGYTDEPLNDKTPPPPIYGYSSGVVGLRLFPNPNFNEAARKHWDAQRYYNDPTYYGDPELVRPYRVGMSCAFCHASAHPLKPPLDPAAPEWQNLSGTIGSQYLRIRAVVGNLLTKENFIYHVLDSQPPGTIDTSLVASDNINNPNAMNAIFGVRARLLRALKKPREKVLPPALAFDSLWPDPKDGFKLYKAQEIPTNFANDSGDTRYVPAVLFDASDSVGASLALARVYLNIGTYSEQWIRLHDPLLGLLPPKASTKEDLRLKRTQLPFLIEDCEKNSIYWQATKERVTPLIHYFLRVTPSMPLMDAAGDYVDRHRVDPPKPAPLVERIFKAGHHYEGSIDTSKLARGRKVFAQNCIVCHSSIQPESDFSLPDDPARKPPGYAERHQAVIDLRKAYLHSLEGTREIWDHDPGQWLRRPEYRAWASEVVENADFWSQNYLSSEMRVPVTYVGTNSARSMATNATNGHMWQDFSSWSNRNLQSVGSIKYFNPFSQQDELFEPRHKTIEGAPIAGGGPGFYRPSSLISIWATAPFLHNNTLGHFNNDPSVKGRLEAFDDAIHKLLYPERRLLNSDYAPPEQLARDHGLIWRTPGETYISLPGTSLPGFLRAVPIPDCMMTYSDRLAKLGPWRAVPTIILLSLAFVILLFKRGQRKPIRRWRIGWRLSAYLLALVGLGFGFLAYLHTGGFGDLKIGPIPAGTPVNLIANMNPEAPPEKLHAAIRALVDGITEIKTRHLSGQAKDDVINQKIGPALMSVNKCPDFVLDKGHFYPWFADMSPDDKEALIELLKTF